MAGEQIQPTEGATPAADAADPSLLDDAAPAEAGKPADAAPAETPESKPADKAGDDGDAKADADDLLADDDEGKTPDKADGPADAKKGETPETYEALTLPEGVQIDEAVLAQSKTLFGELNIPLDTANKLVAHYAALQQSASEQQIADFNKVKNDWAAELRADPEFGGDNLKKTTGATKTLVGKYGSPQLLTMLKEWGWGNNPELNRMCARISAALSEDTLETADAAAQSTPKSAAEVMWPSMFKQE